MPTGTVRLHRVLRAPPERVYRAFLDADAMAKWIAPYGFTCKVHNMDARVGGTFRMSFTNFNTGSSHAFGGEYLELVPNERIRYTDKFDDPNLPGEIQVRVTFAKVSCGTESNIVQEGLPEVVPVEMKSISMQAQSEHISARGARPGVVLLCRVKRARLSASASSVERGSLQGCLR